LNPKHGKEFSLIHYIQPLTEWLAEAEQLNHKADKVRNA
jgi:hypothetical protein